MVALPPDRGEGQQWSLAPGNLVSTPRVVRVDPAAGGSIELALDRALEAPAAKKDPSRVRRVKIKSELLTRFWGREVSITALVLLPEGWESHPQARYPLIVSHGHFSADLTNYREEPPDPELPPSTAPASTASAPAATSPAARSTATAAWCRRRATGSPASGPARASRASSWSSSSTPTPTTTTPTR